MTKMDPKRYGSRKFILSLIALVSYIGYGFYTGAGVDPIGCVAIIGAYGFMNVAGKKVDATNGGVK